ncbi:MAG: glycosyltransferase [Acidobacteriota bacterium]
MTIVIPTKNSSGHIDLILEFYRQVGAQPVIFVDEASADDTYDVCRRSGFRTELVANPLGRVEGIIEAISWRCDTDWILRFDDDEVPSVDLLLRARALTLGPPERAHAFRLRHCVLNDQQRLSALRAHENPPHDQWRLYNRRHVSFTTDIHSPGIAVRDGAVCPADSYFLHLQWIVRSIAERQAKIAEYDRQVPNAGSAWRQYYLIEEDQVAMRSACEIERAEFAPLAEKLFRRFPLAPRAPSVAGGKDASSRERQTILATRSALSW